MKNPKLKKLNIRTRDEKPFLILKEQKKLKVEKDSTIVEEIEKTYIEQSKYGDGKLKDKGDLRQKNLYFSNVRACPREIYYKFFEPERARDYTVKGLILFDDGNRHHINIQRRLEDRGNFKNPEGFLEIPEVGATGYYDGLVKVKQFKNGNVICDVVEIKSKLPYACEEVDQVDYDQAQLYHYACRFSKRLKGKHIRVKDIRIIYKDRAVQTEEVHFAWTVKQDKKRQEEILDYFRFLKSVVIDKKTLVVHPYEKKSLKCNYCLFKEYCWREYPEKIEEKTVDLEKITLPDQEIVESYAKKFHKILKQQKKLSEEREEIEEVLINYFTKTKSDKLPISKIEALAPKQSKRTEWDYKKLRKAIGDDLYSQVSTPSSKLITEIIKSDFIDASKFEKYKKLKLSKMSLFVKKIKEEP
jgi:CRISPR/Cas system-associated exonuclease Cas4 (RecB family)